MNLKDLIAKVTGLEARATEAFKTELADLKTQVTGALQQLQADLATATTTIATLGTEKAGLESSVAELTSKLSDSNKEFLGYNELLTQACLTGQLLDLKLAADATPEQIHAAALAVPMADKFKAYQGALNAAFGKAGLPQTKLPTPASAPISGAGTFKGGKLKLSDFRTLKPVEQSAFCAAVRRGEAELLND